MLVRSNAKAGRNKGLTMSRHWWPVPQLSTARFSFSLSARAICQVSAAFPPETATTIGYLRT
jgi:hypothetical protein